MTQVDICKVVSQQGKLVWAACPTALPSVAEVIESRCLWSLFVLSGSVVSAAL